MCSSARRHAADGSIHLPRPAGRSPEEQQCLYPAVRPAQRRRELWPCAAGGDGSFRAIVEAKDCTPEQAAITEVNTGAYVFRVRELLDSLDKLTTDNAQGELYLTDVPAFIKGRRRPVGLCDGCSETEMLGVNTVERSAKWSGSSAPALKPTTTPKG